MLRISLNGARLGRISVARSLSTALGQPLEPVLAHEKNKEPIRTGLRGMDLLNSPRLNKGAAFTREERTNFGLEGLLPYEVHGLEMQCDRAYHQLKTRGNPLSKYTFLASLRDQNQVLFYHLILRHLKELLPIIYTPTVGEAIQHYSMIFRRPDGLFLTYPDRDIMRKTMLDAKKPEEVDLIVVTDSEGILGIGDMGTGGILICLGKCQIYSLGAGINPSRVLPVVLDVGTDNQQLLNDPLYLGLRRSRMRGREYDDFVSKFCDIVREEYPSAFLHFEDFGTANAGRLLSKFRPKQSVFNGKICRVLSRSYLHTETLCGADDMQGTAAVVLAALMSAVKVTKSELKHQRIVVYGFGTAGLGIADGIRNALMIEGGLTSDEARKCFWVLDRPGLLTTETQNLRPGQENFVRDADEVAEWTKGESGIELLEVVKRAKPTMLIGCSTAANSFNEQVIKEMAKHVDRPVIFPLSNPTRLAECDPSDANEWTDGRALIATGSPFPPVMANGKQYIIAEANNALVYPALGLGVIISKASRLSDAMITAGVSALASLSPALKDPDQSLLPSLSDLRSISVTVATAVANAARKEGVAHDGRTEDWTEEEVRERQWDPVYRPLEYVETKWMKK